MALAGQAAGVVDGGHLLALVDRDVVGLALAGELHVDGEAGDAVGLARLEGHVPHGPRLSTREPPETNDTLTSEPMRRNGSTVASRMPSAVGTAWLRRISVEPLEAHPRQPGQRLLGLDEAAQHLLDVGVHLQKADAEPAAGGDEQRLHARHEAGDAAGAPGQRDIAGQRRAHLERLARLDEHAGDAQVERIGHEHVVEGRRLKPHLHRILHPRLRSLLQGGHCVSDRPRTAHRNLPVTVRPSKHFLASGEPEEARAVAVVSRRPRPPAGRPGRRPRSARGQERRLVAAGRAAAAAASRGSRYGASVSSIRRSAG